MSMWALYFDASLLPRHREYESSRPPFAVFLRIWNNHKRFAKSVESRKRKDLAGAANFHRVLGVTPSSRCEISQRMLRFLEAIRQLRFRESFCPASKPLVSRISIAAPSLSISGGIDGDVSAKTQHRCNGDVKGIESYLRIFALFAPLLLCALSTLSFPRFIIVLCCLFVLKAPLVE